MKKSVLFNLLFFTLNSMEQDKPSESIIVGKKKFTLNPLKNISHKKKLIYITNFQKIIDAFLKDIAERMGRIEDINTSGIEEYTKRLKRSQHYLIQKEQKLKKLEAILEIYKENDFELTIKSPKKFSTLLDVCLNLFIKQKLKYATLELIDIEEITLKLIAFLYSQLKEIEQFIDKQEEFYETYLICCNEHQKQISMMFLQKSEKSSRWLLLKKLKELGDVVEKPLQSKKKVKKESYPFKKNQKIEYLFYFKKIDSLIRKKKKRNYISNIKKQTEYWLYKALEVDSSIIIDERSKQIYAHVIGRLNYLPGSHNIFSATKKERQASKLYQAYEYKSPGSLEALKQEQPSLIEKFDQSKEGLKKEMINLLVKAEEEIENEQFAQAEIHLNKAMELGGTNSLIHHMMGRLENSGYKISLDYKEACERSRRLSRTVDSSLRRKKLITKSDEESEGKNNKLDQKKDKGKEKVEEDNSNIGKD